MCPCKLGKILENINIELPLYFLPILSNADLQRSRSWIILSPPPCTYIIVFMHHVLMYMQN